MPQFINHFATIDDGSGNPASGFLIAVFDSGTNNLAQDNVWADSDLSVALTNPVQLDSWGKKPNFYLTSGTYKIQLQTPTGTAVETIEEYTASGVGEDESVHLWLPNITYSLNDLVEYQSNYFFSLKNNNLNNTPSTAEDDANWNLANFLTSYNSTITTYATGDLVVKSGIIYRSRVDSNSGNDPESSPIQWANASGIGFQSIWVPATSMNNDTVGPTAGTAKIGSLVVITKEFSGSTLQTIQFDIDMPVSWDRKELYAIYNVVSRATPSGDITFNIDALSVVDDADMDQQDFGAGVDFVFTALTEVATINVKYASTPVSFNVASASSDPENNLVYFKSQRVISGSTVNIGLIGIRILYSTVSSTDHVTS